MQISAVKNYLVRLEQAPVEIRRNIPLMVSNHPKYNEGVEKYPFDEESSDIETFQPAKMTGFALLRLKIDLNLNPFCLLSGNPDRSPLVIRPKRSVS